MALFAVNGMCTLVPLQAVHKCTLELTINLLYYLMDVEAKKTYNNGSRLQVMFHLIMLFHLN